MKETSLGEIVDRLRINLRVADIVVSDEDLKLIAEKGFLNSVLAFETAIRGGDASDRPEFAPKSTASTEADTRMAGHPIAGFGAGSRIRTEDPLGGDIVETVRQLRSGETSPLELLEASLARIESRNPSINAFANVRAEEARAEAKAAGEEFARGSIRGPLQGIPVAVKDIFDVEGMATKAGTIILGTETASRDATAVGRLKKAGAIIVGKTRLPEFSFSPGSNNDHYGPTRNPRDPERDSGGSSAGSAAAVADSMALAALGSDSGGSIRIPASFCGVFGWKPAYGWASLEGSVGLSWSLDTLGVLAKSVRDAELLASILADRGPMAETTAWKGSGTTSGRSLAGMRIAAIRGEGRGRPLADPDVLTSWATGLDALRDAGADVVDVEVEEFPALRAINGAILSMEAAALHRDLQAKRLSDYGEFARLGLLVGWAYGPADYLRARQSLGRLRADLSAKFPAVDLYCSPTMTSEATALGKPPKITFTAPFNALGWPAMSVPWGRGAKGLPVGLQLAAEPGGESAILEAAAALEARLP